ncbi:hypothetical protein ATK36_1824 [Amycolatopsis sulphurea]|uniref:Uncharacterized protein n=1 Tax=Amycolatopsis sulphurea TaxID=76022 RepID=A0A2A9F8R5_9PSEU|nr:hypothetical protein ATK36_1824 [Amycolatopsis sulphurea]
MWGQGAGFGGLVRAELPAHHIPVTSPLTDTTHPTPNTQPTHPPAHRPHHAPQRSLPRQPSTFPSPQHHSRTHPRIPHDNPAGTPGNTPPPERRFPLPSPTFPPPATALGVPPPFPPRPQVTGFPAADHRSGESPAPDHSTRFCPIPSNSPRRSSSRPGDRPEAPPAAYHHRYSGRRSDWPEIGSSRPAAHPHYFDRRTGCAPLTPPQFPFPGPVTTSDNPRSADQDRCKHGRAPTLGGSGPCREAPP